MCTPSLLGDAAANSGVRDREAGVAANAGAMRSSPTRIIRLASTSMTFAAAGLKQGVLQGSKERLYGHVPSQKKLVFRLGPVVGIAAEFADAVLGRVTAGQQEEDEENVFHGR